MRRVLTSHRRAAGAPDDSSARIVRSRSPDTRRPRLHGACGPVVVNASLLRTRRKASTGTRSNACPGRHAAHGHATPRARCQTVAVRLRAFGRPTGNLATLNHSPTSQPYCAARGQPVDWWPWSDEAFATPAARCTVLISVGIPPATVPRNGHESFEDDEVAQLLNAHFLASRSTGGTSGRRRRLHGSRQLVNGSGGGDDGAGAARRPPFLAGTYLRKQPSSALEPGGRAVDGNAHPGRRCGRLSEAVRNGAALPGPPDGRPALPQARRARPGDVDDLAWPVP